MDLDRPLTVREVVRGSLAISFLLALGLAIFLSALVVLPDLPNVSKKPPGRVIHDAKSAQTKLEITMTFERVHNPTRWRATASASIFSIAKAWPFVASD